MSGFASAALRRVPSVVATVGLVVFGLVLGLLLAEGILRVYNPIESRVRGYNILLPVNQVDTVRNATNSMLDPVIITTRNSLGFRGPEPPRMPDSVLTLLAIGGSTTECRFLSDGRTWIDVLGRDLSSTFAPVWINNAGLDGHSTFGHLVLLDTVVKMRAKPKVILLLIGANDRGRDDLTTADSTIYVRFSGREAVRRIVSHSEVLAVGLNLYRYLQARQLGVVHGQGWDLEHRQLELRDQPRVVVSDSARAALVELHRQRYVPNYRGRVRSLVSFSRAHGIEPVLITQPALLGDSTDDVPRVHLGDIARGELDVAARWDLVEVYNDVAREVGEETGSLVIDLARKLPKRLAYFYDWMHYNNEGAAVVGEIIFRDLCPFLAGRYPQYARSPCPPGADPEMASIPLR